MFAHQLGDNKWFDKLNLASSRRRNSILVIAFSRTGEPQKRKINRVIDGIQNIDDDDDDVVTSLNPGKFPRDNFF